MLVGGTGPQLYAIQHCLRYERKKSLEPWVGVLESSLDMRMREVVSACCTFAYQLKGD
jgi:hypothetical protein